MNNLKKWTAALRSGEYVQGCGTLYEAHRNRHCCMGVAYDVMEKDGEPTGVWRENACPRINLLKWVQEEDPKDFPYDAIIRITLDTDGVFWRVDDEHTTLDLDYLNDRLLLTFSQIADLIDYFGVRKS